jgi:hypothetical protein
LSLHLANLCFLVAVDEVKEIDDAAFKIAENSPAKRAEVVDFH